jgi:hypothetical protein
MKKQLFQLATFGTLFILLYSCTSTKGSMEKGDYDSVIRKVSDRINKKQRVTDQELQLLAEAYDRANERDLNRINGMKNSGYIDKYPEIFEIYNTIEQRQSTVLRVSPLYLSNGETIVLSSFNYSAVKEEARENAAEFYYRRGTEYLKTHTKRDARLAYTEFNRVLSYYSEYKDTRNLFNQSLDLGTSHVFVLVDRQPGIFLPPNFEQELLKADYNRLVSDWVRIYYNPEDRSSFDFAVKLIVTNSVITPSSVKEEVCDEFKDIEDGWKYQYDSRGNVMKDSSGNDIKIPKYIRVTSRLIETRMYKAAAINGEVQFYDYNRKSIIRSVPARGESVFNHYFAFFTGDKRALSDDSRRKLNSTNLPFPSDPEIMLMATNELKKMIGRILDDNQNIFLNYYE